jgi:16S rRNA (uracil1498-N3)-methyltransferase
MRAIFYPFVKSDLEKNIVITDEQAKHLQVVRIRQGEEVLVLNGKGLKAHTTVGAITKTQVELIVKSLDGEARLHDIHLAIANPKKDAFEDILKIAVEMGVKSIQPLRSEFSQYDYEEGERFNRILESALVQSNNAFLPKMHEQKTIEQFLEKNESPLFFFNSKPTDNGKIEIHEGDRIILIGPEGGFSEREISLIMARPVVFSIHMPTPIQRAPTAVASSIGYLLAKS